MPKKSSKDDKNNHTKEQASTGLPAGQVPELDYLKIHIPTDVSRVTIGGLNTQALAWLNVAGYLLKKSLSQMCQTAVYTYLARNRQAHLRMLMTEAEQRGLSPEETFEQIVDETMVKGKGKR